MLSVLSVDNYGYSEMLGDSVVRRTATTRETMTATTRETRDNTYDYRVSTMADMINKFKNGEIVKKYGRHDKEANGNEPRQTRLAKCGR
jgi:dihydroxyacetone kinase-like predicted kinase